MNTTCIRLRHQPALPRVMNRVGSGVSAFFFRLIDHQSIYYRKTILLVIGVISLGLVSSAGAQTPLDRYVDEGMRVNPSLAALSQDVEQAHEKVLEARRNYLPTAGVNLRYTRSGGGRIIEFPVGDLLNPVYSALNDFSGSNAFPQIENESFRLLREKEQESKISLVQPLFLPVHRPATRALSASADIREHDYARARRDLIADIQDAYLAYHQAREAIVILEDALALVTEAERVTSRLVENGLATTDELYRLRAERSEVEQELAGAQTSVDLAAAYFNTLLSRPPEAPIETMDLGALESRLRPKTLPGLDALETELAGREELASLEAAIDASAASLDVTRSTFLPQLVLVADAGIQGERYEFDDEAFFRTASVVLTWNLFDGNRRASRVEQSKLARAGLESRREALRNQLELQLRSSLSETRLAEQTIAVAERGFESARNAYRLTERRYQEDMATLLDLLDARATLTGARQQLSLTRYSTLLSWVELKRVSPGLAQ